MDNQQGTDIDVDIRLFETTLKRRLFISIGVLTQSVTEQVAPDQVACVQDSEKLAEQIGEITQGKDLISVMLALDWLADVAFAHHIDKLPDDQRNFLTNRIDEAYIEALSSLAVAAKKRLGTGTCPRCAKTIPRDSQFCPYCKTKFKKKPAPSADPSIA